MEQDAMMYFVYDEEDYVEAQYMRTELDKLANNVGLKSFQTIREYLSKGLRLANGKQVYKQLKNDKMIRII